MRRYGPTSPDKHAHAAVAAAIRQGLLSHPASCEACGVAREAIPKRRRTSQLVWHHHSYAPEHWTDVIALCHGCHKAVHTGRIPEPRTGHLRNDYAWTEARRSRAALRAARKRFDELRAAVRLAAEQLVGFQRVAPLDLSAETRRTRALVDAMRQTLQIDAAFLAAVARASADEDPIKMGGPASLRMWRLIKSATEAA